MTKVIMEKYTTIHICSICIYR